MKKSIYLMKFKFLFFIVFSIFFFHKNRVLSSTSPLSCRNIFQKKTLVLSETKNTAALEPKNDFDNIKKSSSNELGVEASADFTNSIKIQIEEPLKLEVFKDYEQLEKNALRIKLNRTFFSFADKKVQTINLKNQIYLSHLNRKFQEQEEIFYQIKSNEILKDFKKQISDFSDYLYFLEKDKLANKDKNKNTHVNLNLSFFSLINKNRSFQNKLSEARQLVLSFVIGKRKAIRDSSELNQAEKTIQDFKTNIIKNAQFVSDRRDQLRALYNEMSILKNEFSLLQKNTYNLMKEVEATNRMLNSANVDPMDHGYYELLLNSINELQISIWTKIYYYMEKESNLESYKKILISDEINSNSDQLLNFMLYIKDNKNFRYEYFSSANKNEFINEIDYKVNKEILLLYEELVKSLQDSES